MSAQQSPKQNHILGAVPPEVYERLLPALKLVPTEFGQALYEYGSVQNYVYFPAAGIVSLVSGTESGNSAEIALIGNDGTVGIPVFMGGNTTPSRAVVRSAGSAYRLAAPFLKKEARRGGPLQMVLLRFIQALITQMTQTAICIRHHSIEQQFCRWLLLSLDRLTSNELIVTQELMANMMGVSQERATEVAGRLQATGTIEYSRGRINVLDRPKLAASVCECYSAIKRGTDRYSFISP